jgi:hypothetical protein
VVRDAVLEALRTLPPRQRAAVVLRYLDDLPIAEVARALDCSEDLLDRVRAGGRRRVVRRRTLLAAGLTTVVAGSAAGVVLSAGGGGAAPVASPLLDDPTRGDLRRDREFRDQVHAVWRDHVGGIAVRGEPHLVGRPRPARLPRRRGHRCPAATGPGPPTRTSPATASAGGT